LERTRSTIKIYAKELKERLKEKEDVVIISQEEIKNLYKETRGVHKTIEAIQREIAQNPTAKVIIEFPLVIKELSDPKWFHPEDQNKPHEQRRLSPYVDHLGGVERFRKQRDEAIKQWFNEKGIVDNEQLGPNPQEIAKDHLRALRRMEEFVRKIFPENPLKIVVVGHSLELDVFYTFLANQGEITPEGFEKIGGKMVEETEPAQIILFPGGKIELRYRGKTFEFQEDVREGKDEDNN